jgi:ubiquinone/menaquinone biosynthesis C-methylase UbiE
MGVVAAIYRQFQRPTGLLGRLAGWIMSSRPSNIERNRWTVDLLEIQPRDHVLEIGFGPGLSIAHVARLASNGRVVGVDHSPLMVAVATRRSRSAVDARLVDLKLGGLEMLASLDETFDKVFSINAMQFMRDRVEALKAIRSVMKPDGIVATTFQPRQRGAKAADARAFADKLSQEMIDAGFRNIRVETLDLKPTPVVCVLGCR